MLLSISSCYPVRPQGTTSHIWFELERQTREEMSACWFRRTGTITLNAPRAGHPRVYEVLETDLGGT